MTTPTTYLGMSLSIDDLDVENKEYFRHCSTHQFHLQSCVSCKLLRYTPGTACPWCGTLESKWMPVEGKGAVHSYTEVRHVVQPGFKEHSPYLVLLVDLDTQKGRPSEHEALRIVGNLTNTSGKLASPEAVKTVGIGSRMRMVFTDIEPGISIPQWTIDESAKQPEKVWRFPQ